MPPEFIPFAGGGRFIERNGAEVGADEPREEEHMNKDPDIERFYTSTFWKKRRREILDEHGGLCQLCLEKGLIEPAVHVHHRIPLTSDNLNDPRITLDSSNLMALCETCHAEQHRKKRWRCGPNGHIEL